MRRSMINMNSQTLRNLLAEIRDHPLTVNTSEFGHFHSVGLILHLGLLLLAHRDKVLGHVAHVHHGGSVFEHLARKMSNVDIIS